MEDAPDIEPVVESCRALVQDRYAGAWYVGQHAPLLTFGVVRTTPEEAEVILGWSTKELSIAVALCKYNESQILAFQQEAAEILHQWRAGPTMIHPAWELNLVQVTLSSYPPRAPEVLFATIPADAIRVTIRSDLAYEVIAAT